MNLKNTPERKTLEDKITRIGQRREVLRNIINELNEQEQAVHIRIRKLDGLKRWTVFNDAGDVLSYTDAPNRKAALKKAKKECEDVTTGISVLLVR